MCVKGVTFGPLHPRLKMHAFIHFFLIHSFTMHTFVHLHVNPSMASTLQVPFNVSPVPGGFVS